MKQQQHDINFEEDSEKKRIIIMITNIITIIITSDHTGS